MEHELSGQGLGNEEEEKLKERQQRARQASVDQEFLRAMQEKTIKERSPPRKFPKKLPAPSTSRPAHPLESSDSESEEEEKPKKQKILRHTPPKKKPCSCKRVFSLFDIVIWVFAFWGSYSAGKSIFEFVSSFLQKTPGEISVTPQ